MTIVVNWNGGVVFWTAADNVEILSADEFDASFVEQVLGDPVNVFRSELTGKDVLTITEVVERLEADGSEKHARAALLGLPGAELLDTSE